MFNEIGNTFDSLMNICVKGIYYACSCIRFSLFNVKFIAVWYTCRQRYTIAESATTCPQHVQLYFKSSWKLMRSENFWTGCTVRCNAVPCTDIRCSLDRQIFDKLYRTNTNSISNERTDDTVTGSLWTTCIYLYRPL